MKKTGLPYTCLITDSNAARSLLNSDFGDSGVVDSELRRLLVDLESVNKQAYVQRRGSRGTQCHRLKGTGRLPLIGSILPR